MKMYHYENCGTCRKARKWLDERGIAYTLVPVREQPPTETELKRMLKAVNGDIRKLFNTSGGDYKAMNMKEKLPQMTDAKAIALLAQHGNLVKRPFVIGKDLHLVGFREEEWKAVLHV
jgi:Spx/MgsR family transcriptional regulator